MFPKFTHPACQSVPGSRPALGVTDSILGLSPGGRAQNWPMKQESCRRWGISSPSSSYHMAQLGSDSLVAGLGGVWSAPMSTKLKLGKSCINQLDDPSPCPHHRRRAVVGSMLNLLNTPYLSAPGMGVTWSSVPPTV